MRLLTIILLLLPASTVFGQNERLFIPKEIQDAYEKGTRSFDGKPGPNYWQNTADYKIDVEINPTDWSITGSETVTYHNNSPGQIDRLVVRLYYDVFKKANPRDQRVVVEDIRDGAEINSVTINGKEVVRETPHFRRGWTHLYLQLPEPLNTGESVELGVDWKQWIPKTNDRTGALADEFTGHTSAPA